MTFNDIRNDNRLLFESIRGSHLFGLNTDTSDIDTFGVFIGPKEWFLGIGLDKELIVKSSRGDDYWDELEKYFTELSNSNPEALISLFTPKKFILHYNNVLDPLFEIRDSLITKKCFKTFSGYAYSQIKKAKGLKKAINIDPEKVKLRKTPLDFCQVPMGIGTWSLTKWLRDNGLKQEFCGVSRLPNSIETYSLYYDWGADKDLSINTFLKLYVKEDVDDLELEKYKNLYESLIKNGTPIGYRGVISTSDPLTSQIRLSSIPKSEGDPICYFQFNSNAYSSHCTDYKRYWDWVRNRNQERFNLNKNYNFDSKNMSTCIRILTMGKEMAEGKGMILDRTGIDKDFLLDIKNHKVSYDEVINYADNLKDEMEKSFEKSKLPDEPDKKLLNNILISIRENFYFKNK